jgi:hypothetical protein
VRILAPATGIVKMYKLKLIWSNVSRAAQRRRAGAVLDTEPEMPILSPSVNIKQSWISKSEF